VPLKAIPEIRFNGDCGRRTRRKVELRVLEEWTTKKPESDVAENRMSVGLEEIQV
jgi:hypothetical protein